MGLQPRLSADSHNVCRPPLPLLGRVKWQRCRTCKHGSDTSRKHKRPDDEPILTAQLSQFPSSPLALSFSRPIWFPGNEAG